MIIPGEDPAELDQLTAEYEQQFHPVDPIETDLLETVVRAVFAQDSERGDTLAKIFRRQQAAQRDWCRAIDAFRALQSVKLGATSSRRKPNRNSRRRQGILSGSGSF